METKPAQNIQDSFLNNARREKAPILCDRVTSGQTGRTGRSQVMAVGIAGEVAGLRSRVRRFVEDEVIPNEARPRW